MKRRYGCVFLIIIIGSLLGFEMHQQYEYGDLQRYEISRDNNETWLIDSETMFEIEKDAQCIDFDKNCIYSYGKSGFAIIDRKTHKICYFFDDNTLQFRMLIIRLKQKNTDDYITIKNISQLSSEEKVIYKKIKTEKNKHKWCW